MTDVKRETPVLQVEGLHVWFGSGPGRQATFGSHILQGVNLSVAPGERLGLVGESGCGKTTTILAAMGLLPPTATVAGRVLLNGKDVLADGEKSIQPHRWTDVAMVFQGAMSAFNPVHTIGWQIAEAIRLHTSASRRDTAHRVDGLLELVGIPPQRQKAYPHEFSGGMRQRAGIAMALACDPKVLLADEPTTALDVVIQDQILSLLNRLCSDLDLALVLVTHDLGVVAQTCDRAAVMLDGQIVEDGSLVQLFRSPAHPYTRRLFEATPSLSGASKTEAGSVAAPPPLLEVTDLRVTYPRRRTVLDSVRRRNEDAAPAVDGVSLRVGRGELVALVGQSGCGKTTTAQSILGMVGVTGGSIRLDGVETTSLNRRELHEVRRRIQMVYQDPYESLDGRFRVRQTLEEPLRIHRAGGDRRARARLVGEALERVGLSPAGRYLNRYPHELSGGQRQRVSIASCLVLEPDLLLADEPVSMLDVSLRLGVLELLNDLRADSSLGILMITHDLSTAATYADRIVVMKNGRVVEENTAWQIVHEPREPYTRLLLDSVPSPVPVERARSRLDATP